MKDLQDEAIAKRQPFFADRPIETRSDDLLGRAQFAVTLAEAIGSWRERDSLVIALYGGWGSGKTSIKNMALEALRASTLDVHPIEFNPWQWSSQDRLFEAFFREIGTAVGQIPDSESGRIRRLAEKWQEYGAYLRLGATVAGSLRRLLAICTALLATGWLIPGVSESYALSPLFLLFACVFFGLAGFFGYGGQLANHVSETLLVSSNSKRQTAEDIKASLTQALKTSKHTVVVVIDDIDRLPALQILSIFQIVKANADSPGLVYVLLFDRPQVEAALKATRTVTPDFIEKIVQVGFDVPIVERSRLENVLFAELDRMLATPAASGRFQRDRWSELFLEGLRPYFQTMRQVKRYASSLSFHMSLLAETGTLEVNFVDPIGLEALRVFEVALYRELPSAKAVLTDETARYGFREVDERAKIVVEHLLNRVLENRRSAAEAVLRTIFPTVRRLMSDFAGPDGDEDSWVREARACSPEFFDRYFQLSISENDISKHEIEGVLSASDDKEQLVKRFRDFRDRGLLDVAMDRLEAYKQTVDIKHAVPFLAALFDVGDWLGDRSPGFFDIPPIGHASRILNWYLRLEPDPRERGRVTVEAARQSEGIRLLVHVATNEESRREKGGGQEYLMDDEHLGFLKKICVERITRAAEDGSLQKQREALVLLYRWKDWAGADQPRKWVASLLSTPEGVLWFLVAVTTPYSVNGRVRWAVRLKYVEDFTDVACLEAAVAAGLSRELEEEEIRAINEFRKALRRRSEGKSDDAWSDDEEW